MALQTDLFFTTDLSNGVTVTELRPLLFTGDEDAHRFVISVMRDGQAENLSGANVVGYFIRADEAMVTIEGSVDSQGRAVVVLNKNCYSIQGRYQFVIRVTQGDVKTTIFCADGYMRHTTSDTIIDEDNIIPSLDDLLAQIAVMEQATARANAAADKANNAQGPAGVTPNLTIGTVSTLPAGSLATASFTGTAENPVLNLGIPKGVDGDGADGTVQSVNGETGAVSVKRLNSENGGYVIFDKNGNEYILTFMGSDGKNKLAIQGNSGAPSVMSYHYYNQSTGEWLGNANVYSTVNKPTPGEIGALPLTGGAAIGSIGVSADSYPQFILSNASGAHLGLLYVETANGGNGSIVLRTYSNLTGDSFYQYKFSPNGGIFVQSGGTGTKYEVLTTNAPIVIGETVVSGAQISANGYVSNQLANVTAISGYTPLAVIAMQTNSSYVQQYAMYLADNSIVYSVRNYSSQAVTPTYYFRVLYVRS